jgi:hypothetical protein
MPEGCRLMVAVGASLGGPFMGHSADDVESRFRSAVVLLEDVDVKRVTFTPALGLQSFVFVKYAA